MKKSLIALAVIGAFAGTAAAQTNVTLYGIGDIGIGAADSKLPAAGFSPGSSSVATVFSGIQSTSRFGIRGTEDLGSGLKATFNLESGVDFSNGDSLNGTQFWARRAVVGLAGGFGEVRLGRDYTPGFTAAGTTDVMGYGLFGNWLTFTTGSTFRAFNPVTGVYGAPQTFSTGGITTRASNGLHYTSPNWGGVTVRAMYAAGENDGSDINVPKNTGDMYGLSGVFANGPLTVSGYWQATKVPDTRPFATGTATNDQYGLGAQYSFGMFRVALNYGEAKPDVGPKLQAWGLGGGVKIGTGEVLLNFIQQKIKAGSAFGPDPKGTTWGLAYVYPMSKRTNLYASYGQTRNNETAAFNLSYSGSFVAAGTLDSDPRAFAIGVRHMF